MVTYPSTHGVFEQDIAELCELVHDGRRPGLRRRRQPQRARRAWPGRASSAPTSRTSTCTRRSASRTAAAVRASGRSRVRAHLAPYLPNHPLQPAAGRRRASARSRAAPWGSAGILPISWAYVRLMGADGLTRATAGRDPRRPTTSRPGSAPHYPVLYTGAAGWSPTSASSTCGRSPRTTGVTVDDVAKRLIDYGFHAPTMSFPVAGHADDRADGVRGPRRARPVLRRDDRDPRARSTGSGEGSWTATTTRCAARRTRPRRSPGSGSTPTRAPRRSSRPGWIAATKYWPPVRRIDGAYGDRNLVCSCPPVDAYGD